jgi:hypothetical protein
MAEARAPVARGEYRGESQKACGGNPGGSGGLGTQRRPDTDGGAPARRLVDRGKVDVDDVAERYLDWWHDETFDIALEVSLRFAVPANYCPALVGSLGGARWGRARLAERCSNTVRSCPASGQRRRVRLPGVAIKTQPSRRPLRSRTAG